MKNKFLYLNCLLLLFLCLIGFSPQDNVRGAPLMVAHASQIVDTDGTLSTIDGDSFDNQLDSYLEGFDSKENDVDMGANIKNSVKTISTKLSSISKQLQTIAFALSITIITLFGFKFMMTSNGSITQFLRSRQDMANALICVVFITAIPYFARGVLELKLPSSMTGVNSDNQNIGDIMITPTSDTAKYILENSANFKAADTNTLVMTPPKEEASSLWTGLVQKAIELVLVLITSVCYIPLAFVTTLLGYIGFYPVSFDIAMYSNDVADVLTNVSPSVLSGDFLKLISIDGLSDVAKSMIPALATGLERLTNVVNLLYYVIKKFCMLGIELICYYYGILHLLGKDTSSLVQFFKRFFAGLVGMLLAPHLIEFMLDMDSVLATSILSITGSTIPGFSLMNILPSVEAVQGSFVNLAFGLVVATLVLMLAKSFFIRRVEITLYYLVSPVIFLRHMVKADAQAVKRWFGPISSAIFLTTIYAPVFLIINIFIMLGGGTEGGLTTYVYYMLIVGILLAGKPIISGIIAIFSGVSLSAANAAYRFNKGLSLDNIADASKIGFKTVSKSTSVASKIGVGGVGAAISGAVMASRFKNSVVNNSNIKNKSSIKENAFELGKGIGKTVASGASNAIARPFKKAEQKYWEKYAHQEENSFATKNAKHDAKVVGLQDVAANAKEDAQLNGQVAVLNTQRKRAKNRARLKDTITRDAASAAAFSIVNEDAKKSELLMNRFEDMATSISSEVNDFNRFADSFSGNSFAINQATSDREKSIMDANKDTIMKFNEKAAYGNRLVARQMALIETKKDLLSNKDTKLDFNALESVQAEIESVSKQLHKLEPALDGARDKYDAYVNSEIALENARANTNTIIASFDEKIETRMAEIKTASPSASDDDLNAIYSKDVTMLNLKEAKQNALAENKRRINTLEKDAIRYHNSFVNASTNIKSQAKLQATYSAERIEKDTPFSLKNDVTIDKNKENNKVVTESLSKLKEHSATILSQDLSINKQIDISTLVDKDEYLGYKDALSVKYIKREIEDENENANNITNGLNNNSPKDTDTKK